MYIKIILSIAYQTIGLWSLEAVATFHWSNYREVETGTSGGWAKQGEPESSAGY